jgi:hypothetical protein
MSLIFHPFSFQPNRRPGESERCFEKQQTRNTVPLH